MPRAGLFLSALLATAVHGGQLGISYNHPFFSPADIAVFRLQERGGASLSIFYEPVPFIATGPKVGWSYWDFDFPSAENPSLHVRIWEFAWSVMPTKRIAPHAGLFLEASIGLQHLDYSVAHAPDLPGPGDESAGISKSEWGSGRSIGLGLDLYWFRFSVNHDAILAESLLGEFAGLRGSVGVVFRNRP